MNHVILSGRLTRDPEIRYTQSGKEVASFTLAVDRRGAHRDQTDGRPTADFVPCVAWEKRAEFAGNYLRKGTKVEIHGRLQVRSYEDQQGGRRWVTEVIIDDVEFAESKKVADANAEAAESGGQMRNMPQQPSGSFGQDISDEEIPF